eukprot:GHVH01006384.1.p1 GENE.GHVH01006384.1~~GHVH01006384.1.p1  ORF type:complete len:249 (+),score=30.71 GHVH01006384.1:99-845(+)
MARRYDSRTTTFSPEGRLFQVEYAMEAINNASSTLGIQGENCVVIAADKPVASKLLDQQKEKEKIFKVADHIIVAVAGWTADANVLIANARSAAQEYLFTFDAPIPIRDLAVQICDIKQGYTQFGGLRPFGVSFLIGGWDKLRGFQLYHTDPAGNFSGWHATAIGMNNQAAQAILKSEWEDTASREDAITLATKALVRSLDNPRGECLEFCVLTVDENGCVTQNFLEESTINELVEVAVKEKNEAKQD